METVAGPPDREDGQASMRGSILDRYLARSWIKIFVVTALGFPLVSIVLELTDKLAQYLNQGLTPRAIAWSYVFSLPHQIYIVLPAAVLFATVFSIGTMGRHSELIASHASGRSFHRIVIPVILLAMAATGLALLLVEVAPSATARQLELLGERERRAQNKRFNFVYRAEEGWVYAVRSLDLGEGLMRDVQLEREGTGLDYPTIVIQGQSAVYNDTTEQWMLHAGNMRFLSGSNAEDQFAFDSLRVANLVETPSELLAEAKRPEEMRYQELGEYISALERSGGDGRKLQVQRALKIAVPFTCLIIALFAAPLANVNPRASGAYGIAISLGTTITFLILVQLSQAAGASGLVPPNWAAWIPNLLFLLMGLGLFTRVRT